ncbi:MAG: peptidoglycan bridge formation glycyltransferase FemA/FemB family protein [Anaerolineales bacterium]
MKTIAISLSPNTSRQDTQLALRLLAAPHRWQSGKSAGLLERRVAEYVGVEHAFALDSGRSGLYLALKAMGIGAGDEVLLQAYTCIAVPNSVVWAGATPRYADIEPDTLNVNLSDLEAKITPRTRAIIVQHTFGRPAPVAEIVKLAHSRGIRVIEDCAHAIGGITPSGPVGRVGNAAIFSFGRDKVISSVSGGMVVTRDPDLAAELGRLRAALPNPSTKWTFQHLFHPVAFSGILPTYDVMKFGKAMLVGMQKAGLLNLAVTPEERRGQRPAHTPSRLPDAVARLALSQLARLDDFNRHRRQLAALYAARLSGTGIQLPPPDEPGTENIYLRYTIHIPDPDELHRAAQKRRVYLGNWYDTVISPKGTNLSVVNYTPGECPVAERQAAASINLPTHPKVTLADGERVVGLVLENVKHRQIHNTQYAIRKTMPTSFSQIETREEWDHFVQNQPYYSFLHSWEWGNFNELQGDEIFRPEQVVRLGMYVDGALAGAALLLRVRARRGRYLFCPHGPLMDWQNTEQAKTFIRHILDLGRKTGAWFVRFSPLIPEEDTEAQRPLREMGFRPAPIHEHAEETWLLDISPEENDLLMGCRKGTRNLIRRAKKDGVEIIQSDNVDDLAIFDQLYADTATRHDFVPYSLKFLRREFETFHEQDRAKLFFARYQGNYISGAVILYYGKTAFYHHGASSSKFRKVPGNHGLQWASILEAKRRGCTTYNFWGIAPEDAPEHPWKGLTFFKKGFGGYRIDFMHAHDRILSPLYWVTYWVETARRKKRGF